MRKLIIAAEFHRIPMVIVILIMIVAGLDLYIGNSADHDNCGGGSICSIKII
jgi:hypothetical protein